MKPDEPKRTPDNESKPEQAQPPESNSGASNPSEEASEKKPFVFKIVPADPKNAFDFEDVADK